MVSKEAPLIVLYSKYSMCMAKNGKDTKHTRQISRRMHYVRNGEKYKMHKIDWCEGFLKLADIVTKNVSEPDQTPRMKYIMVRLENWDRTLVQEGWQNTRIVYGTRVLYDESRLSLWLDSISLEYPNNKHSSASAVRDVHLDELSLLPHLSTTCMQLSGYMNAPT